MGRRLPHLMPASSLVFGRLNPQLKSLDKKIAALRAETRYMQGDMCNGKNDAELRRLEQVSFSLEPHQKRISEHNFRCALPVLTHTCEKTNIEARGHTHTLLLCRQRPTCMLVRLAWTTMRMTTAMTMMGHRRPRPPVSAAQSTSSLQKPTTSPLHSRCSCPTPRVAMHLICQCWTGVRSCIVRRRSTQRPRPQQARRHFPTLGSPACS
jgi:hypothetical protein